MSEESYPVNNLLGTAKSREIQRATFAEMRGDRPGASLHFLAAAHMELVLAADYQAAGDAEMAWRSQISAASCFWRGGEQPSAQKVFGSLVQSRPDRAGEITSILAELGNDYPAMAS